MNNIIFLQHKDRVFIFEIRLTDSYTVWAGRNTPFVLEEHKLSSKTPEITRLYRFGNIRDSIDISELMVLINTKQILENEELKKFLNYMKDNFQEFLL